MKKETRKVIISIVAIILLISSLCACNKKQQIENNNNLVVSGDFEQKEDLNTYNNGGNFVQYKGKIYFREYSNADIQKKSLLARYLYETELQSSKYINAISQNGKIENVFEDNGFGNFYILDDRFFFTGYNNKLYSVDLKGNNYIEFCKGSFVGADEKNHKIYYKNERTNNALYSVDTTNLKITKLSAEDLNVIFIDNENIYFSETLLDGTVRISKLEGNTKNILNVCDINIESEKYSFHTVEAKMYNENLFILLKMNDTNIGNLYHIDLKNNQYMLLAENIDTSLKLDNNTLYFQKTETTGINTKSLLKINLKTMEMTTVLNNSDFSIENNNIVNTKDGLIYLDENSREKYIVSAKEISDFKLKYNATSELDEYEVNISNIELVGEKIYYLCELSKVNKDKLDYERIASEVYMFDLKTNKKTLLYLYAVTDKDVAESGDIYSGDIEEPLAENEMYLKIKLDNKGLKETFDIRVEEVGGSIIGKRIEYEGTHSRNEGTLKIKVTKEIGAMLTVYIDNKIDSQMVIE